MKCKLPYTFLMIRPDMDHSYLRENCFSILNHSLAVLENTKKLSVIMASDLDT